MDYEDGEPLSQMLQRERTLSEEQIRRLLGDVLPALEAVHAQGYLHRDLKPANLYRRSDGRTILIDFGAARQALGRRSKSVTSVFSPGYSPIEQYLVDGKGYGPWTDIYAVGAVLYHCVTGVAPIEAPARVLDDPIKPAAVVAAGRYGPALLRLVDRSMAVRPENVSSRSPRCGGAERAGPAKSATAGPAGRGRRQPHGQVGVALALGFASKRGEAAPGDRRATQAAAH